ncbi:MAG: DUF3737 family protein [Succinivibrionaceae bacterium]|nr:DUF3737 family protein [Succinivibrionaceae bacterium]
MKVISQQEFGGERPLFRASDLRLEGVTIHAGESALKECHHIEAEHCRLEGKYPFWHNDHLRISRCTLTEGARAALWYGHDVRIENTLIEAPKALRDLDGVTLEDVRIPNAQETLWHCANVRIRRAAVHGADYIFMHSHDLDIADYEQHGNYSFQYASNITISHATLHTKDAFWNSVNVTVRDSVLDGEYLGWHSENLRLINCRISGTQPLCYARNLILEHCTLAADADLAFEYSTVRATIDGPITSVKNPRSGSISAHSIGEIIIDEHVKAPADCRISVRDRG